MEGENFNLENNEEAPKDPFVQEMLKVKDGILNLITEIQSQSTFPQNYEAFKEIIESEYKRNIKQVNEVDKDFKSKMGAEYLISATKTDFATKDMSKAFSSYTDKFIEGMKESRKVFDELYKHAKETTAFIEKIENNQQLQEIKEFLKNLEEKYQTLVIEINDKRTELNHQILEDELEKPSEAVSQSIKSAFNNEKLDEYSHEAMNRKENIYKTFVSKCEEISKSIFDLIEPKNNN